VTTPDASVDPTPDASIDPTPDASIDPVGNIHSHTRSTYTKEIDLMSLTLAIIKPDAVGAGNAGRILSHLEQGGFSVRALRMVHLTDAQAGEFYAVHSERPFYGELVEFMTSGPCIPVVLEAEDAVPALREAIGATDPAEAAEGTVRKLYAESKGRNAIHASDSDENAAREIGFFFSEADRISTGA